MRKSRLSIALMTSLLGVSALAGCDPVKFSPEGNLITYTIGDNNTPQVISAKDIFEEYYNDSDKYQSIFDAIKSIIIRNYFTIEEKVLTPKGEEKAPADRTDDDYYHLGLPQMDEINSAVNLRIESDKDDATTNANKNSTSYNKEFEAILKSNGVKTEQELRDKYLDEEKTSRFNKNYEEYFLDEIKSGYQLPDTGATDTDNELKNLWTGYFNDMLPYHVSHILVNVGDSSETNYYNGTITEDNCTRLYQVVKMLQNSDNKKEYTFKNIAYNWSNDDNGDSSSKNHYGDLGIMDYSTSFVNEFKLGIYAFENLFGNKAKTQESNIDIPGEYNYETPAESEGLEKQFFEAVNESYEITAGNQIPSVEIKWFEELYKVREQTKSASKEEIMDNSTLVYPRNVIYNQYLNRHSFAFVTDENATEENFGTFEVGKGYQNESATGMHAYTTIDDYPALVGKGNILSTVVAGRMRPVLMVRAGGANYQGIHFIVVNRDPFQFDEDYNGVNMKNYYTTNKIPTDPNKPNYYPSNDGLMMKTYSNFYTNEYNEVNSRIKSFGSTLQSYDSDKLSKFIFKKYIAKENIKITDENLEKALNRWIDTDLASKKEQKEETWETQWTDYISTLRKQNSARNSLMTQAARIGFEMDMDLTKVINSDLEPYFIGYLKSYGFSETEATNIYNDYADFGNENGSSTYVDKKPDGTPWTIGDLYNVKGALCNDGKAHK